MSLKVVKTEKCETCGNDMRHEVIDVAGVSKTFWVCSVCPDTSEQDRHEEKVLQHLAISGIPKREIEVLSGEVVVDEDNKVAMEAAKEYGQKITEHMVDGTGIIFLGTVGSGKSIVMARLVQYLARKLVVCRWVRYRYFANLVEGGNLESEDSEGAELYRFERYPVLAIDDFLDPFCDIAPWQKKKLINLIEVRYENKMPTIYTTNATDEDIVFSIGPAMWSRIKSVSKVVIVTGKDRRGK